MIETIQSVALGVLAVATISARVEVYRLGRDVVRCRQRLAWLDNHVGQPAVANVGQAGGHPQPGGGSR